MPSGTRIERTEETVAEIEATIMGYVGAPDPDPENEQQPESNLRILISNIGVLMDWPAAYTPNNGPMDAFVLVQLKGKSGKPDTFATVDALREQLKDQFPAVDFAFDTFGGAVATEQMMGAVRKGGTGVLEGLAPEDTTAGIDVVDLVRNQNTLAGSYYGSVSPHETFARLVEFYLRGQIDIDSLITRRYTLDEINEGYDALGRGEDGRGVIVFGG